VEAVPWDNRAQVPFAGAPSEARQVSHAPVQAALQHTPSEQWPEAHWPPAEHDAPSPSSVPAHAPAAHVLETHWRLALQASPFPRRVTQATPSQ
jgi:hypothetical protein